MKVACAGVVAFSLQALIYGLSPTHDTRRKCEWQAKKQGGLEFEIYNRDLRNQTPLTYSMILQITTLQLSLAMA